MSPALIDQPITNRWSGKVQFTAKIEADPQQPLSVRVGLAVKWAIATGADLTRAYLTGADLTGADLTGADLTGAYLTGADLTGADLTGAYLTGADLTRADLARADLTGADLTRADLTGADLARADLTGADLTGAKISRVIARSDRSDGYAFLAFEMQEGGVKIMAGCRWFSPAEYRAHIAAEYPGTDKAAETGRILDLIEGRMADLGIGAA